MNSPDLPRPGWHRQAKCRGLDPDLFFPTPGASAAGAKAVCATCPVKAECYEAGRFEHFGVWGGTTRRERQVANKGHTDGRVPVRGCWRCGMPTEGREHYCSDECRKKARARVLQRYHLNREQAS